MGSGQVSTRERFVSAAARLFAERGYSATSVADIQLACGMTGGSGALYKHFRSKEALLHEVIGGHLATMRAGTEWFREHVPDDIELALSFLADAMWTSMQRDRDVLRVTLRDLEDFPELLDRVWSELQANVFAVFASWVTTQVERGTARVADPEATAAVLLASLTHLPLLDTLVGHTPGDIDAQRYRSAWVHHAVATLTSSRTCQ